jgi:2-C-methyl-D-erythritol 2,4-cyclodiphosphate synthase
MRIGQGYDVHRLVEGRLLLLGGVEIPFDRGLLGHSDGDAVLHALCDALLGAIGAGDIGTHFPDTDPRHRGVASEVFVAESMRLAHQAGFVLGNADVTIFAERPRLAPHMAALRANVARLLGAAESQINLKAKTMEGLDAVGRGEAIAASAVVLLVERSR